MEGLAVPTDKHESVEIDDVCMGLEVCFGFLSVWVVFVQAFL